MLHKWNPNMKITFQDISYVFGHVYKHVAKGADAVKAADTATKAASKIASSRCPRCTSRNMHAWRRSSTYRRLGGNLVGKAGDLFHEKVDIEQINRSLTNTMANAALLAGFASGMTLTVSDADILSYASWLKSEYFGRESHYCQWVVPHNVEDTKLASFPFGLFPHENPWYGPEGYDGAVPCDANNCWVGHWDTQQASRDLNFTSCSLSAGEVKKLYPEYWNGLVQGKVVGVQQELGYNTMAIIITSVAVVFLSTLLLISLSKHSGKSADWVRRFEFIIFVLSMLPLLNFFNFLKLANRVLRVKLPFCDDFISDACMVTSTPMFDLLKEGLGVATILVLVMHLTLPRGGDDDHGSGEGTLTTSKASTAGASNTASLLETLERLGALREKGHISGDEFMKLKAEAVTEHHDKKLDA